MEVKLACDCGQHYAFDVEPADRRMPVPIQCPGCGKDGTPAADAYLELHLPSPPPVAVIKPGAIRISAASTDAPTRSAVLLPSGPSPAHLAPAHPSLSGPGAKSVPTGSYLDRMPDAPTFSLLRGGIGAVIGAVVSSALLIGLSIAIGFRFPLFGIIIGYLTGLGARWMARGTDNSLGIVASVIALLAVTGSLVFLFNSFSPFNLITIAFAVGCAWRVSSG
jgi:hypothetical protein